MLSHLREAFESLWASLWRRSASNAAKAEHEAKRLGRIRARADFWAEFRKGQREADARASKQR